MHISRDLQTMQLHYHFITHRSVPANGEETFQLLANGKFEKLKTQRNASSQRPEKMSHQFQLSMLQVKKTATNNPLYC